MKKTESSYTAGGNEIGAATVENSMEVSQKLKIELPWDDHDFIFPFINVVYQYHIDWFAYVEPSLWHCNNSNLIMVYEPFYVLLDSVC